MKKITILIILVLATSFSYAQNLITNESNVLDKRVLDLQPNSLTAAVNASNLTAAVYVTKISTALGIITKKLIKQ